MGWDWIREMEDGEPIHVQLAWVTKMDWNGFLLEGEKGWTGGVFPFLSFS